MKRVVQNKETIDLDSINWENPHIGIVHAGKNFLQEAVRGGFNVVAFDALSRSSYSANSSGSTFRGAVENALSRGYEVYVFDSHKELFKWLAE